MPCIRYNALYVIGRWPSDGFSADMRFRSRLARVDGKATAADPNFASLHSFLRLLFSHHCSFTIKFHIYCGPHSRLSWQRCSGSRITRCRTCTISTGFSAAQESASPPSDPNERFSSSALSPGSSMELRADRTHLDVSHARGIDVSSSHLG